MDDFLCNWNLVKMVSFWLHCSALYQFYKKIIYVRDVWQVVREGKGAREGDRLKLLWTDQGIDRLTSLYCHALYKTVMSINFTRYLENVYYVQNLNLIKKKKKKIIKFIWISPNLTFISPITNQKIFVTSNFHDQTQWPIWHKPWPVQTVADC